jgi:hypothetical protein
LGWGNRTRADGQGREQAFNDRIVRDYDSDLQRVDHRVPSNAPRIQPVNYPPHQLFENALTNGAALIIATVIKSIG